MKLLITIVQDQDVQALLEGLTESGFSATKLASTGGFLKGGNTTLIVGVEDEKVPEVLDIIGHRCKKRSKEPSNLRFPFNRGPKAIQVEGATVFILDVERFERI